MSCDDIHLPSNARRINEYSDGFDNQSSDNKSSKANSYLANFLTSSLLNSVSFTQPPPNTTTHKHPLNLQTMSLNFRNFVQNTGPLFAILDAVEGVILWKSTSITILVVLLWTVLCLHPALVLILPQFSLICVILYNHSVRFPKEDIKVVDNDDAPAKHPSAPSSPTSPTSPTFPASPTQPTQPPPEPQLPDSSSPDYYLNLQSIQNLMGTTNDGIDYVMPIYRKLNWSDIEQSNGGYLVLALNHPLVKEYL
ncbi:hypothetical protein E3P96_02286 [Wallemia ichthyophaga]|uniref:TECPR1-like DysF domain-containing protein n=1 Tax=Wallemia ichthyophaga TaxID=245174 RepID=A0A4T0GIG6_WALIC|nr:hypothetical protein E3P96_02286 [Wallemia ichthyophaga]TIB38223.1 hypothetical protein E3P86_01750 [Wallemia ichthyophaga]